VLQHHGLQCRETVQRGEALLAPVAGVAVAAERQLDAVKALQKRDGAAWVDVDVKPWLAKEPKACREADND